MFDGIKEIAEKFRGGVDRELLKRSMLYTCLLGFFAHGFAFVNLSVSHDAVFDFYDSLAEHQHQIGLGRVLEPLYREATASGLLMPWSTGIRALFWLGLAVFLVCRMFDLTGRGEVFLTAGIMSVNISVTAVAASYMPWLAADMFALFLAVAGAVCWQRYGISRVKKHLVYGVAAVTCSLALYQCYLAVTVVLIILLSMQQIVRREGAAKVFRDDLVSVGMLALGGGLYYVLMKSVSAAAGTPLAEGYYDSVTNLWDNREPVMQRMISCMKEELTHFFASDENIYPPQIIWAVNLLLFCTCACLAVRLVRQGKSLPGWGRGEWALLLLLTAVLPFAAYMMRLLNTSVHDLMVYAVWMLYLLPLLLRKWTGEGEKARGCVAILLGFLIFSYIQTDNAVYVKKEVESKATLSLMTEIMAEVDRTEGYIPGETPVTFVGELSGIVTKLPGTERVEGVSGCNKSSAITYPGTYQAYFDNVMLRDVKVVFDSGAEKKEEVGRMPSYPQPGYVKLVDGVAVVRLE